MTGEASESCPHRKSDRPESGPPCRDSPILLPPPGLLSGRGGGHPPPASDSDRRDSSRLPARAWVSESCASSPPRGVAPGLNILFRGHIRPPARTSKKAEGYPLDQPVHFLRQCTLEETPTHTYLEYTRVKPNFGQLYGAHYLSPEGVSTFIDTFMK